MTPGQTLIDKALAGRSLHELERLGIENRANLRAMVQGKRNVPPHVAAKLAALIGDDPREAALASVIEKEDDPEKRVQLARLLRVPLAACVTAMTIFGSPESNAETPTVASMSTASVYYVNFLRRLMARMRNAVKLPRLAVA
jgi:hypothetical protein